MPDKRTRSQLFAEANKTYRAAKETGGKDLDDLYHRGRLAKIAKRAGGQGFPLAMPEACPADSAPAPAAQHNQVLHTSPSLENQARAVRKQFAQARHEALDKQAHDAAELDTWSRSCLAKDECWLTDQSGLGCRGQAHPSGMAALPFDHVSWIPPVRTVISAVSAGTQQGWSGAAKSQATIFRDLERLWGDMHRQVRLQDVERLGAFPTPKVKLCFVAGFCLCGRAGAMIRRFVETLQKELRPWLAKGSMSRQLYDHGALCLRVADVAGEIVSWYHFGHGNLNTNRFALATLEEEAMGPRCLAARHSHRVACTFLSDPQHGLGDNLWQVFQLFDFTKEWRCEAWRLHSSDEIASPFLPSLIELEPVVPRLAATLSSLPRKRKRKGGTAGEGEHVAEDNDEMWRLGEPEPLPPLEAPEVDAASEPSLAGSDTDQDSDSSPTDNDTEPTDSSDSRSDALWDLPAGEPEEPVPIPPPRPLPGGPPPLGEHVVLPPPPASRAAGRACGRRGGQAHSASGGARRPSRGGGASHPLAALQPFRNLGRRRSDWLWGKLR